MTYRELENILGEIPEKELDHPVILIIDNYGYELGHELGRIIYDGSLPVLDFNVDGDDAE